MRLSLLILLALLLLCFSTASARTWYVRPDGAGDAPTIQAGIDSAAAADTVLLADGTYTGEGNRNITFGGKPIVLVSESGDPDLCIIDCESEGRGFLFDSGETDESVLEGVTIVNGLYICMSADSGGGGIWCDASSPTIRNTVVSNCLAEPDGGGMWCHAGSRPSLVGVVFEFNDPRGVYSHYSSPELVNVTFRGNWDGGMGCRGGNPVLTDVLFQGNHGSGLSLIYGADAILTNVVFSENGSLNSAGGLYCFHSSPSVSWCTFYRNGSGAWGGGMRIHGDTSAPIVRNCTFFGNSAVIGGSAIHGEGSPVFERLIIAWNDGPEPFYWFGDCPSLMCCDIYGNAGGDWVGCISGQNGVNGNFSACPSFCNAGDGDFHLCDESPCLPGNHPDGTDCGLIGVSAEGCNCGPSRAETTTWGGIKSLYR